VPHPLATQLRQLTTDAESDLRRLADADTHTPRSPGAWSKRQILGHLIDSTAANHQRFVRAQFTDELRFPTYDAPGWVDVQHYDIAEWGPLVDLFVSYSTHLAYVLEVMPDSALDTPCWVDWFGEPRPISLREVVDGYLEHVRGHLAQILEPAEPPVPEEAS
jgi:hypothetical protein